jgi:triphosphoribosyl-dephospho-CoA synthase
VADPRGTKLGPGALAQVACLLEVAAPKPGNVSPGRGFAHLSWLDFAIASVAIGPVLERAPARRLGATVLDAVRASRAVTPANANVGIVLLLAPLASVPLDEDLRQGVRRVLGGLSAADAADVYQAIREADPKGLGRADEADVFGPPPADLIAAMRLAAGRDTIARQYANGFEDLFEFALPRFESACRELPAIEDAIVRLQLELLRRFPDTHIGRRAGLEAAREAAVRAARVLARGWPADPDGRRELESLDKWLREDNNQRNPGTTADMIAATLFVALRLGTLRVPLETIRDPGAHGSVPPG